MTQPQQQEYIITEDMLRIWRNQCIAEPAHTDTDQCKACEFRGIGMRTNCCDFGDSDMEKIFRSRPAPAPLDDGDCDTCLFGEQCRVLLYVPPCYNHGPDSPEHAAAQAREKVLDEIDCCACTDGEWFTIGGKQYLYLNYSVLSKKIDEIREAQR